jgi:hypothetical protein
MEFRLHYSTAVNVFINDFPKGAPAIISTARLIMKNDIVELQQDYNAADHSKDLTERDFVYAILALLKTVTFI